jgi:hypothetical protein
VLAALALLLAACAVHAVVPFAAGPLAWLLEKWGYKVVLVASARRAWPAACWSAQNAPPG